MLNTFLNQGYIHLKQVIPQELLKEVRTRSIQLKNKYKSFEGKPDIMDQVHFGRD